MAVDFPAPRNPVMIFVWMPSRRSVMLAFGGLAMSVVQDVAHGDERSAEYRHPTLEVFAQQVMAPERSKH